MHSLIQPVLGQTSDRKPASSAIGETGQSSGEFGNVFAKSSDGEASSADQRSASTAELSDATVDAQASDAEDKTSLSPAFDGDAKAPTKDTLSGAHIAGTHGEALTAEFSATPQHSDKQTDGRQDEAVLQESMTSGKGSRSTEMQTFTGEPALQRPLQATSGTGGTPERVTKTQHSNAQSPAGLVSGQGDAFGMSARVQEETGPTGPMRSAQAAGDPAFASIAGQMAQPSLRQSQPNDRSQSQMLALDVANAAEAMQDLPNNKTGLLNTEVRPDLGTRGMSATPQDTGVFGSRNPPAGAAQPANIQTALATLTSTQVQETQQQEARYSSDWGDGRDADLMTSQTAFTKNANTTQVNMASPIPASLAHSNLDISFKVNADAGLTDLTRTIDGIETLPWDVRGGPQATSVPTAHLLARAELPPHIAQQLAQAMHRSPDRSVELTLNPPELGKVRMVMTSNETGMTVTVVTERAETLDLMRRNIDDLGSALGALGYEDIDFAFSHDQAAQDDHNADSDEDGREEAQGWHGHTHSATAPLTQLSRSDTGLDVRI